ncbi:hypothetical protein BCR34DRAFT_595796 [Clohesyomyces aquaticus]|uniref:Tubby C-terminal-like domain-containing protein n=1 Tax=Clohesyomyces aquaticus TaxID=1231657 RepID=A0A1Y2A929_9PLEO|nr:hypothetical protein BCR34DRAFT_595796 [Clohesyomyces aquaticus]
MAPSITPTLNPIPPPGLVLFPGFTAQKQEAFFTKQTLSGKLDIWIGSPDGLRSEFLRMAKEKRKNFVFRNASNGAEVMRIVKETHFVHSNVYHVLAPDGTEKWSLKLNRKWSGTEYEITLNPSVGNVPGLLVQNKILGQAKGILLNGTPVATTDTPEVWSHLRREDLIHVAAGMDILLPIAVTWIRIDKENEDAETAASAA